MILARIALFPLARRRALILQLANGMASRPLAAAEKYLQRELRRQINVLHRKGCSDRVVEREVRALEWAVRAEVWRVVIAPPSLTPPGAA
jgi:hypothetical protein